METNEEEEDLLELCLGEGRRRKDGAWRWTDRQGPAAEWTDDGWESVAGRHADDGDEATDKVGVLTVSGNALVLLPLPDAP